MRLQCLVLPHLLFIKLLTCTPGRSSFPRNSSNADCAKISLVSLTHCRNSQRSVSKIQNNASDRRHFYPLLGQREV